jgi:hypothetical protein
MSCAKHSYPDKRAAISARKIVLRTRGRHSRPMDLRPYFCEECRAWHLTKQLSLPAFLQVS